MQKHHNIVFYLICCFLIFLILNNYYTHQFNMDALFNSDSLTVPDLVRDLFANPSNIFNWNFSRAPSFQDVFFYGIINSFFNSTNSIAIFAAIQFFLTALLVYKLYQTKHKGISLTLLSSLSILLLGYVVLEQLKPYTIILKVAHHYSEYLFWLIASVLLIKYLRVPNRKDLIIIIIISFIICLNDRLFYIHFIIPALVFSGMKFLDTNFNERKNISVLIIGIIVASLLAYIFSNFFSGIYEVAPVNEISINSIQNDLSNLYQLIIKINSASFLILIINVIFYLLCIYSIAKRNQKSDWIYFYLLSLLITILIIVLVPSSKIIGRYLLPFLYTPLLFILFILPNALIKKTKPLQVLVLIVLLAHLMFFVKIQKWNFDYYPENVQCVDDELSKYSIQNVISGFWESRYFTFLSKRQIKVLPFHLNLSENKIVINRNRFLKNYSAVLVNNSSNKGLKQDYIINQLGSPNKLISCSNFSLLVYNKKSLIINKNKQVFNNLKAVKD